MQPRTAIPEIAQRGNVLAFAPSLAARDGRLSWRDRIALHEARDRLATAGFRYEAHPDRMPDGTPYDLVQLFRGDEPWSSWCLVRRRDHVQGWRCADGADLGLFGTMHEALVALLAAPAYARARRPNMG